MKILSALMLLIVASHIVNANEIVELQAKQLSLQIRCPVCQGQSIEDSNAPLAVELKKIIRDKVKAGQNNVQILNELESQYGTQILLNPPFKPETYLLWLTPFFLAGLISIFLVRIFK